MKSQVSFRLRQSVSLSIPASQNAMFSDVVAFPYEIGTSYARIHLFNALSPMYHSPGGLLLRVDRNRGGSGLKVVVAVGAILGLVIRLTIRNLANAIFGRHVNVVGHFDFPFYPWNGNTTWVTIFIWYFGSWVVKGLGECDVASYDQLGRFHVPFFAPFTLARVTHH